MSYFLVNNFNLGIDRRRPIYSSFDGAVWEATNCHLSRGGDLEKRKAFVEKYVVPDNTFGLLSSSGSLYVFGSTVGVAVPTGITYQQLSHPDGLSMTKLLSATSYDGKPYVVAKFIDGAVYHFYDGAIVPSFSNGIVRQAIATASAMALQLTNLINADTAAAVTATVLNNVITITANAINTVFTITKDTTNGGAIDDQSIVLTTIQAASPSLNQITTATIGGTMEVGDKLAITINDVDYGFKNIVPITPTAAYTFRSKVYGLGGSLLGFSGTGNAISWNFISTAGAGFLNLATADAGSAQLTGLEVYQGYLAVFSASNVQIYIVKDAPAENQLVQVLKNTGTTSQKSVLAYGDIDVFYLSASGIRSIRARAPSNAAFVNDIGTTIDDYVRLYRDTLTQTEIDEAVATIEPVDGRYMLALKNVIYVLSYFPSSQISGWTSYTIPFVIDDFATSGDKLFARSENTIYLYGGDSGNTYDNTTVFVQLPFLNGKKSGTGKQIQGMDVSATGSWDCNVLVDPNDLTQMVRMGDLTDVTWDELNTSAFAYATHIAPNFTNTSSEFVSISSIGITYEGGDEKA